MTASIGARALLVFCTWYYQFVFTNKWLPTIPIIQPSNFVPKKEKPIQMSSCLQLIFPYTNSYCIRHINYFLNQFYKNRDIQSILYINQNSKSLFVIIRILSQSNHLNNVGSTYLQQLLVLRWIISNIISFIFNNFVIIIYVMFSSNLLSYHCF